VACPLDGIATQVKHNGELVYGALCGQCFVLHSVKATSAHYHTTVVHLLEYRVN